MKTQMLLAVWGLLAVYVSSADVEPVQVAEFAILEGAEGPVQIIESSEEIGLDDDSLGPVGRSGALLARATYFSIGVPNTIILHPVRYRSRSTTRISSIRWRHISAWGQTARVTAGGVGRNIADIEIRSIRGGGYHTQVEIFGRY